MIKLSDYVISRIAQLGVKHVFFLPGGGAMHLNESLGRNRDLQYVCNLHEQACSIAAEAYAKVTGTIGVAIVTSGPGGTNAVTGVAAAWLDSTPCIFISGQVKRADLKRDSGLRQLGVQEVDIVSIVKPITKYSVTILDPSTIRYELEKALHLATHGRQGPVWIDLPMDVQAAVIDPDKQEGFKPQIDSSTQQNTLEDSVGQLVQLLNASERPVLVAGNGIRLAGAQSKFAKLVELIGIPTLTTWLGLDLLADNHPLNMGRPGAIAPRSANFALQNSDLMLTIGARLDTAMTGYAHHNLARGARKVMVDIDPSEIAKMNTRIDLPIVADANDFIDVLFEHGEEIRKGRPAWISRCHDWKKKYPLVGQEHRSGDMLSMYHFSETLSDELAANDIIASGSSGFACEIFLLVVKVKQGQRVFHARGLGAMGFGLPAAIGACFGSGLQRTICVDGDGGFQMNIQELETVSRYNLPIKFFVVNNNGYASIRSSQTNYFKHLVGCDASSGLTLPNLRKVATAYGVPAELIEDPGTLREQIKAVLNRSGPVVCEVKVAPDEARAPRLASAQRPDGSMVSKPLEDLWPFLERSELLENMLIPAVEE